MMRAAIIAACVALGTAAQAQPFPDPRARVEIRYDRPETKSGANSVRVKDTQCRESVGDPAGDAELRRRIVTLAAREWEAFRFPVLDIASVDQTLVARVPTPRSGWRGRAIVPNGVNPLIRSPLPRALRLGLVEDDGEIIERIGGYWAVTPGQGAVAAQNVIWGRGGWPGTGWAQPWSAAFISWTMCEAGLSRAQFARGATHAAYLQAIFAAPTESAFTASDLSARVSPGDLVCAGRADNRDIATLDEARVAAGQGALMHCDIVAAVMPDRILLIGGNVMNTVALTVAPADKQGRITANALRPWFGVMKLRAPEDKRRILDTMAWSCLGKSPDVTACLEAMGR